MFRNNYMILLRMPIRMKLYKQIRVFLLALILVIACVVICGYSLEGTSLGKIGMVQLFGQ